MALVSALSMWGFVVDDAWIPVRYARHLAAGAGYVFNAGGARTDGVTPLPWPWLLAPFASGDAASSLIHAKCMNIVAWCIGAAVLGVRIGKIEAPTWTKTAALLVVALSVPIAAHAVSGLETGIATSLATVAACTLHRPRLAAMFAGLAAAFRPEMAPWGLAIGFGASLASASSGRPRAKIAAIGACVALAPFLACVAIRLVVFGRPAPLALWAKPSDLDHGLAYAAAAAMATLTPLLVLPSRAILRGPPEMRVLVLAAWAHLATVAAVGGDWMPFARLVAPIAPSLVLAFVLAADAMSRWGARLRALLAVGLGVYLEVVAAPEGRLVTRDRNALIEAARPLLASSHRIAALDIGWPSAASEGEIVDLAGLTDPEIAALPGGHTSKRVDAAYLLSRAPDAVLFYVRGGVDAAHLDASRDAWKHAEYTRVVEARLARSDVFAAHFAPRAFLPLGESGAGYVLFVPVAPAP